MIVWNVDVAKCVLNRLGSEVSEETVAQLW